MKYNGSEFRALIDGEPIPYERNVSFEPDDIRIICLADGLAAYKQWLASKGQEFNFRIQAISEEVFNLQVHLTNVILLIEKDYAVEFELRFK
jgi:hypothetical protein